MTQSPVEDPSANPPPLTVAASVVGVQGLVLLILAVLEASSIDDERRSLGVSTAAFFAAYGVVLIAAGLALYRRSSWSRGPVLITQLICLGLAWNLREHIAVAIALVLCAAIVLAGMLHPDTVEALERGDQPPDSKD